MKIEPLIIIGACIIIVCLAALVLTVHYVDTSFASEVVLRYYYADKEINVKVTDKNDIRAIKENLSGWSFPDTPSCGFSLDVSITLSDGVKNIVLCPACDGCSKAREGNSDMYLKIKNREALQIILEKYGMEFPCV